MDVPVDEVDRIAYRDYYQFTRLPAHSPAAYTAAFERQRLSPEPVSGNYRGHSRALVLRKLFEAARRTGKPRETLRIVDVGSGRGELSVYLACQGFTVTGIDVSESGCRTARELAGRLGVQDRCTFLEESIERTSLPPGTVDFMVGFSALHHFIKYAGVPAEMRRVLKPGGRAFFSDAFSENPLFWMFQNKEDMRRLGDVRLTRRKILEYFEGFEVELTPTDWFTMFSKLLRKKLRIRNRRWLARTAYALDRGVPAHNRLSLFLSGVVVTQVTALRGTVPHRVVPLPPPVRRPPWRHRIRKRGRRSTATQ